MKQTLLIGAAMVAFAGTAEARFFGSIGGERLVLSIQQPMLLADRDEGVEALAPAEAPRSDSVYNVNPPYPPSLYMDDITTE